LRTSASRRPSACLAITARTASPGTVTDNLNCNWDCAYANEFPVAVEAIAAISEDVLQATFANMERRVQLCLDSGGEHFQHLL
jgi:hypothetical protein